MPTQITWLGHSSWFIRSNEHTIVMDPFLIDNPSATVEPDAIDVDTILVSHGHFDHVNDAASIAKKCNATVFTNYEIASWLGSKHGITNAVGMNIGGATKTIFGNLKMTAALHSSQLPDGSYGGTAGGFLIQTDGFRIYYTGDTGLFSDLALYADPAVDVMIVPIGDLFTMGIEDSVKAINLVKPKWVLPTHFDTWPPIAQDAASWAQRVRDCTSANPIVLKPNESWTIPIADC